MDFSHSSSSFSDRSLSTITSDLSADSHLPSGLPTPTSLLSPSSPSLRQCRASPDLELIAGSRHDRLASFKVARTDSFSRHPAADLSMQLAASDGGFRSLVRSNSLQASEHGRLAGCLPTNSCASDGALFGGDSGLVSDQARWMRNDGIISYAGNAPRSVSYQRQAFPFRSSGLAPPPMISRGEMGAGDSVFTSNQLRELQYHALIFKYLVSGVSVPAELLHPIRHSVAAMADLPTRSHHLATLGWGNYHLGFANTTDPEPGRCRRTDGKKWRCARDVVPDQKYCAHHINRGKNRSRKPAENQTISASQPSVAAGVESNSTSATSVSLGKATTPTPGLRPSITLNGHQHRPDALTSIGIKSFERPGSPNGHGALSIGSSIDASQFQLPIQSPGATAGLSTKDFRYLNGDLSQEQRFFTEDSGNIDRELRLESQALSGLPVLSSVDNHWRSVQSKQQHSFLGGGFGAMEAVNMARESEGQPLRHFFDDWPRTRDPSTLSWSDVDEDRSNRSSWTTQLSISIPMASSDFSSANAGSPRDREEAGAGGLDTTKAIDSVKGSVQ